MLIQTDFYLPMVFAYIYRKKYLETIHARFEEGIVHEDELWMPPVLCQTEKMVIVNLPFYYYRNQEKSITNTTGYYQRVYSMCRVADKLFEFADQFSFSGVDRELKSWFCANIFRLYYYIFELIPKIKDASIELPNHQLDSFEKYKREMTPEPLKRCQYYISASKAYLKEYHDRKNAEYITNNPPKISCLCVTHKKPQLLQRAIYCFENQTWTDKQLVIVYEEADESTHKYITGRAFGDEYKIVKIEKDARLTLGELRNISIREANGSYVCQWDDDDWYDPDRLKEQMNFLTICQKSGCVLSRWIIFDNFSQKAYLSNMRLWEGSILCRRDMMLQNPYPSLEKGEDTSVIEGLYKQDELAIIDDMPQLYVYVFHGNNTWDYDHFKEIYHFSHELPESYAKDVVEVLRDYEICYNG